MKSVCFDLLIYCVLLVLWILSFITTAFDLRRSQNSHESFRERRVPSQCRPLSCWGPLRSWLHHLFGEWKIGFCYAQLSVGGLASAGFSAPPHRQSWKWENQIIILKLVKSHSSCVDWDEWGVFPNDVGLPEGHWPRDLGHCVTIKVRVWWVPAESFMGWFAQ